MMRSCLSLLLLLSAVALEVVLLKLAVTPDTPPLPVLLILGLSMLGPSVLAMVLLWMAWLPVRWIKPRPLPLTLALLVSAALYLAMLGTAILTYEIAVEPSLPMGPLLVVVWFQVLAVLLLWMGWPRLERISPLLPALPLFTMSMLGLGLWMAWPLVISLLTAPRQRSDPSPEEMLASWLGFPVLTALFFLLAWLLMKGNPSPIPARRPLWQTLALLVLTALYLATLGALTPKLWSPPPKPHECEECVPIDPVTLTLPKPETAVPTLTPQMRRRCQWLRRHRPAQTLPRYCRRKRVAFQAIDSSFSEEKEAKRLLFVLS